MSKKKKGTPLLKLPTIPKESPVPWYQNFLERIYSIFSVVIYLLRVVRSFFRIQLRSQNEKPGFEVEKLLAPFAIDIGGTMTKCVYLDFESKEKKILHLKKMGMNVDDLQEITEETLSTKNIPECIKIHPVKPFSFRNNTSTNTESGGALFTDGGFTMKFLEFPSSRITHFIEYLKENELLDRYGQGAKEVYATGGGAYKYAKLLQENCGIKLKQVDEMKSLVHGLNYFVMTKDVGDFFIFNEQHEQEKVSLDQSIYPYILVQIGSGVSFILVTSPSEFKRVSGSSIGGGTFAGLCRLICEDTSFETWVEASQKGNNEVVDLLVGDIYGRDYSQHGLSSNVIASSFGKVATSTVRNDEIRKQFFKGDAIRSLAYMISNNITLIATLNAQKYRVKTVLFSGGFIRDNPFVWNKLRFGMKYWSGYNGIEPEIRSIFVKHDNILGAMGALLHGAVSYD